MFHRIRLCGANFNAHFIVNDIEHINRLLSYLIRLLYLAIEPNSTWRKKIEKN